ncbi:MAG: hypothetical protein KKF15_07970 [Alphaproteobacteria bacterium]|nr:hypothetical protein [Alphaproteobacteria bacterium]
MSVSIKMNGRSLKRPRQREGALDRRVRQFAQHLIARQERGIITSRDLAASLNLDGVLNPSGKLWAHRTVFRMLKRGREIDLPFVVWSRSEAASRRRVVRRSKYEIEAELRAKRAAAEKRRCMREGKTDAAIISATAAALMAEIEAMA